MENKCAGCPDNCCIDFRITTELVNPVALRENLRQYPYIRKTNRAEVLDPFHPGYIAVVGVYNCDRFVAETRECRDYATQPRPDFCENTGMTSFPHAECLLRARQ